MSSQEIQKTCFRAWKGNHRPAWGNCLEYSQFDPSVEKYFRTRSQGFARFHQALSSGLVFLHELMMRERGFDHEEFDASTRTLAACEQRGDDKCFVDDQNIGISKELRQIPEIPVTDLPRRPLDHEQTRRLPLFRGRLRNKLGRQLIFVCLKVEMIRDAHCHR